MTEFPFKVLEAKKKSQNTFVIFFVCCTLNVSVTAYVFNGAESGYESHILVRFT